MGWDFETAGYYVGGLVGGVGNGLLQGAKGAVIGGAGGAVVGAATGAVVGAPTVVGEVATIPSGAAIGAAGGAVIGGGYGAVDGVKTGVPVGADYGSGAGKWLDQKIAQMTGADEDANKQAQTGVQAKATAITCATCAKNPCATLACGAPGSKYRGGAHGCMTGTEETKGDKLDSHHMPARSVSPLNDNVGPAIQMEPPDHYATASYGGGANGPAYALQRSLMSKVPPQTYAVFLLDAADARRVAMMAGDPSRYDAAIEQATAYATCLKQNGIIN